MHRQLHSYLSGATLANNAAAQQPAEADDQQPRSLEEITVTGSRIRRDDFSSAQPTTVMDNEYLQNLGVINLGQAMVGVPQNVNRNSPDANAGNNFFNGSTLANLRGLNPFFGTRTLTLVDSRRHVPTNQGDGVDLNFIPTILIDRVETVTGGASASYGSGAIGGVQNILLDRDFEGIKAEIDFGATGEGDGDSTHYGVCVGAPASAKRGNSSSVSKARTPTASSSARARATGAARTPASSPIICSRPMAGRRTWCNRVCARHGTAATASSGCRAARRFPARSELGHGYPRRATQCCG